MKTEKICNLFNKGTILSEDCVFIQLSAEFYQVY
jgi:hypothetical protein